MSYEHLTFMLSLPRSRSAWMVEFMKPFCSLALHNPLQQCASVTELGQLIDEAPSGRVFVADVAALFFYEQLVVRFPGAKYVVVHRPAHEVANSMSKLGVTPPINIRSAEKLLLEIAQGIRLRSDAMTGTYFELNSPGLITALSQFITGTVPPYAYWRKMTIRNIQVSVADQIKRTDIGKQRMLFATAKMH